MHDIFDKTLRIHGITGKRLSEVTGFSQTHISEFRKGKTNPSCNTLQSLLDGMDELSPGAKRDFCLQLAGTTPSFVETAPPSQKPSIEGMSSLELAQLLLVVADKLQQGQPAKQLISA
ncbi:helix-turn-helix domain-containing protein [Phormidesmis sp. 146-33]